MSITLGASVWERLIEIIHQAEYGPDVSLSELEWYIGVIEEKLMGM